MAGIIIHIIKGTLVACYSNDPELKVELFDEDMEKESELDVYEERYNRFIDDAGALEQVYP